MGVGVGVGVGVDLGVGVRGGREAGGWWGGGLETANVVLHVSGEVETTACRWTTNGMGLRDPSNINEKCAVPTRVSDWTYEFGGGAGGGTNGGGFR